MSKGFEASVTENMLDAALGNETTTPLAVATVHIALSTADPGPAGAGFAEPSPPNGYARVAVSNTPTEWPAATSGIKLNGVDIDFPAATAGGWGTVTHFGIFVVTTGGVVSMWGELDTPLLVNDGDQLQFNTGALKAKLTNV